MMITRMILVKVPTERAAEAERLWKQECAPLMIKQPGCVSEEFLRSRENPGEFISLSTWESEDAINRLCAEFESLEIQVGHRRSDRSHARIQVEAPTPALLERVLAKIKEHGALPVDEGEESAELQSAAVDGIFPDHFYATTNLTTWVRVNDKWIEVEFPEMDCGIRVDLKSMRAECIPFHRVKQGDLIVVGHRGTKIQPIERQVPREGFEFMSSPVSTEQPKGLLIREIAETMKKVRRDNGRILVVAGPGLVHTGAAQYLVKLIERGYVQVLFAGDGLAVHDIETALYDTSLGVYLDKKIRASEGHEHHQIGRAHV